MDCCFFSYFHRFGEEPLNPQESILEKTHLVRIYLQELIFIYQDNFEYFAEINVLVSVIFKISRECNLTLKAKSTTSVKIKGFAQKLIKVCNFDGVTTSFKKTIIWKKVTSITKSREFSRIFGYIWNILWLHLIADEKFIPWYCVNAMLPCQILCWYGNIMNMFQRKSLKLQCKKTTSKKEEIIKLHSDLLRVFSEQFFWI